MFIKEVDLFKGVPSHVIDEIAGLATELSVPGGHVLFQKGDPADFLYILENGRVEITLEGREQISFRSDESGYVFGWSSMVEPKHYTATAKSLEETKVIKIDGDRLLRVFERHPSEGLIIMKRFAGVIAGRLMGCYEEILLPREQWKEMT